MATPWRWIDVIVITLPISAITLIVVSLLTKPRELEGNTEQVNE